MFSHIENASVSSRFFSARYICILNLCFWCCRSFFPGNFDAVCAPFLCLVLSSFLGSLSLSLSLFRDCFSQQKVFLFASRRSRGSGLKKLFPKVFQVIFFLPRNFRNNERQFRFFIFFGVFYCLVFFFHNLHNGSLEWQAGVCCVINFGDL